MNMLIYQLIIFLIFSNSYCDGLESFEFATIKIMPQLTGLNVHIDTDSRHLSLTLTTDKSVLSDNFVFDDGTRDFSKEQTAVAFYSGEVANWPESRVIASIANRRLEAVIVFNSSVTDALFVEDGSKYPHLVDCSKDSYRDDPDDTQYCTIAYQDETQPDHNHLHPHSSGKAKRSTDDEANGMCGWASPTVAKRLQEWLATVASQNQVDQPVVSSKGPEKLSRTRRAADSKTKVCPLYVQIDPTMWTLYLSDFKGNVASTRSALTRLAADLVQGVNEVFRASSFRSTDGSVGPYSGFQFQIAKMRLYTSEEVCNSTNAIIKQLCNNYIDSDAYLKINSQLDQREFCLAYMISHRLFSGGVMGLAWLGYPSGYVGGVCQKPSNSNGQTLSYNTGIITGNNQGNRVTKRGLTLTMAHEIGHNFGSPHDSTTECVPSSGSGYYIMYPYVNPGNKPNNDKFSPCSSDKIARNLETIITGANSVKSYCFRDHPLDETLETCGNQIVEGTEQCDCGSSDAECKAANDLCCTPGDGRPFGCKWSRTAACSPSQGPCCDSQNCQLVPASSNKVCAVSSECSEQAVCSGTSPLCPVPKQKPNATSCASNTRMCYGGECSQSICKKINYDECQEPFDPKQDSARFCHVSCQPITGNNKRCINSLEPGDDSLMKYLNYQFGDGKPIKLPAGSPCDNYKGVCDQLSRCRLVNAQGPIARLFSVLSGDSKVTSPGQWLVRYWWVIAICALVFVAISFCLLKFCSDLLPTSNPKLESKMSKGEAARNIFKPTVRRRKRY